MAKKFVRGITDVKTINNQDFDTNNVNDLLSDGQYNYIHRKKGKNEEYHNLTDNIKTISSDNTELLTVTNNNKTTNTATLHPKHDAQKEQVLESTRDTISIHHGTNGTAEKTTVDTNPKKVLEHENLITNSEYITIEHSDGTNTSEIKTDKLKSNMTDLSTKITSVEEKIATGVGVRNLWIQSKTYGGFTEEILPENHVTGQKKCYRIPNGGELAFNIEPDFSPRLYRKVTFSAWVKYENVVHGAESWSYFNVFKHTMVRRNSLTDDTSDTDYTTLGNFSGTSDWKYITYTYDYAANKSYDELKTILRFNLEDCESGTAWVTGVKVSIGSIQTDYTLSIEDTQEQINSLNSSLAQKQDTLVAGDGITIQGQTISASAPAPGASVSIQGFSTPDAFNAFKHVVTIEQKTLTTFSFECYTETAEHVLSGQLKEELGKFIGPGYSASNGALKLTNDGTDIKLINSTPEYHNNQHATFTFYRKTGGGTVGS